MSANHKLLLLVLTGSVFAFLAAYYFSPFAAVLAAILSLIIIYILRPLVMPAGYGANRIRTLCIVLAFALVGSWGFWSAFIDSFLKSLLNDTFIMSAIPLLGELTLAGSPSVMVLVFFFGCIFVVNYYMRDGTIASGHPESIKKQFPGLEFNKQLDSFCTNLRGHLRKLDNESNWSPDYYTELEAEVEAISSKFGAKRRKSVNLQDAIRSDRVSKSFLVLGAPGAGKSVALRKLAIDMLGEVGKSGRVPIYINLREWPLNFESRDAGGKISTQELERFVVESLKERGDVFTEQFIDTYFRDLWLHGRLFFIFDSFDEIPELLDSDESSESIAALSDVISRFISSSKDSRGVLASRVFRKPTHAFLSEKTLEIRPLSDAAIANALNRFKGFTNNLRQEMFTRRNDLIPVARNPFLMALLGAWVDAESCLPDNQFQIYESYLRKRLLLCKAKMQQKNLSMEDVLDTAKKIAWFVFESPEHGIEAPVAAIADNVESDKTLEVIDVLAHARLARISAGDARTFAFVHRRFMEYFVTVKLLESPQDVPVDHIPTDSRGRDALVLYAQLCDAEEASRLAEICWSEIQAGFSNSEFMLRGIHCLRFLVDAFSSRRIVISSFSDSLAEFVEKHVVAGNNILLAKLCLEATGLLPEQRSISIIEAAITSSDKWLQETAFRACRYLPKMKKELESKISEYVECIPDYEFWLMRKNLMFTLSMAESLQGVHKVTKRRLINLYISAFAFLMSAVFFPSIFIAVFLMIAFMHSLSKISDAFMHDGPASYKGNDQPFRRSRFMFGVMFLSYGFLAVSELKVDDFSVFLSAAGSLVLDDFWFYLFFASLGAAMFDWSYFRVLLKGMVGEDGGFWRTLLYVVFAAGGGLAFIALLTFLMEHQWAKYLIYGVGVIFALVLALILLGGVSKIIYSYFMDLRSFARLEFSERMDRAKIVELLDKFKTEYFKLKFIYKLDACRVQAAGEWPDNFKFGAGVGEEITELAKLEERWLKLDR
ncbi:NACHT domain-containing protein [Aquipseudomonas alcaligenes]|uniref:NACHT domain-containing protein n=1 Tax=Aquipseudomonas alcaligenes TaxID=43263 RepID=A0AB73HSN7_AQUAC|nr:NACHT domain-containing protein [Pseudomonas alcaligenes]MDH0140754.1 NACHT domain-containing protein [Pseudomonas alcaligenes]